MDAQKKKKWSSGKKMTLLAGVLVVLLLGNFLLSKLNAKAGEGETESVAVTAMDGTNVKEMQIDYDGNVTAFTWNATDETWQKADDGTFPVEQSLVKTLFTSAIALQADSVVTEPEDDLSVYGLADPTCVVKLTETDGTETILTVGAQNDFNSCYYLLKNDDTAVYLVSADFVTAAMHHPLDYVAAETNTTVSEPNELTVSAGNESVVLFAPEDPSKYSYALCAEWFWQDEARNVLLDSDAVSELVTSINEPTWNGCAAYAPTAEELEAFGLTEPMATVSLKDADGKAVTLLLGSYDGEDCYAMYKGSDRVWKLSAETADNFRHLDVDALRPDVAFAFQWSKVKNVALTCGDQTANLALNVSAEGELQNCYVDSTLVANARGQKLMDALDVMTVTARNAATAEGQTPMMTMTFTTTSESFPTLTATVTQYDSTTALVAFDNEVFSVSLTEANALVEAFEAIVAPVKDGEGEETESTAEA